MRNSRLGTSILFSILSDGSLLLFSTFSLRSRDDPFVSRDAFRSDDDAFLSRDDAFLSRDDAFRSRDDLYVLFDVL